MNSATLTTAEIFHAFGGSVNVLFYTHINTCLCTEVPATNEKNQPAFLPAGFIKTEKREIQRDSDKEANVRFAGELEEGGGAAVFETIDEVAVLEAE